MEFVNPIARPVAIRITVAGNEVKETPFACTHQNAISRSWGGATESQIRSFCFRLTHTIAEQARLIERAHWLVDSAEIQDKVEQAAIVQSTLEGVSLTLCGKAARSRLTSPLNDERRISYMIRRRCIELGKSMMSRKACTNRRTVDFSSLRDKQVSTPQSAFEAKETRELVIKSVVALPRELRFIILHRTVKRTSFACIAEMLDKSPSWVRKKEKQAKSRLAAMLKSHYLDYSAPSCNSIRTSNLRNQKPPSKSLGVPQRQPRDTARTPRTTAEK